MIINWIKGLFKKKMLTLEDNIRNLEYAIFSTEETLRTMSSDAYNRGACCASCLFGKKFNYLCDKQYRRKIMLDALLIRKKRRDRESTD